MEETKIETAETTENEEVKVVDTSLEDCAKEIAAVLEKYGAKLEIQNTIRVNKV